MKPLKLLHVTPDAGGIADYSKALERIYNQIDFVDYNRKMFAASSNAGEVTKYIESQKPDLVHFEVGSSHTNFYKASRMLLNKKEIRQLVTIHDTQVVVSHPSGWILQPGYKFNLLIKKVLRKILDGAYRRCVKGWINSPDIVFFNLRKNALIGAVYLPQPTYLPKQPNQRKLPRKPEHFGFAGYWSRNKGVETLVDAFVSAKLDRSVLKLYGGGFVGDDPFVEAIKQKVLNLPSVQIEGEIDSEKLMITLAKIDVIVLPYWPDNPAGASAMAARVAELGIPAVVSRVPQLTTTFDKAAVYYHPANSVNALKTALVNIYSRYDQACEQARLLQKKYFELHSDGVIKKILSDELERLFS